MGLYDNAYPNVYEEIKRFYPVWYWDVFEMDAIWKAQGAQLDRVRSSVEVLIADSFVATADATTIAALEEFLHITPEPSLGLSERRKTISAYFKWVRTHIGATEIKGIVSSFTNGAITVGFSDGTILIQVRENYPAQINLVNCCAALSNRIPAHLSLKFRLIYNTHEELRPFWHKELAIYTHEQLRRLFLPKWNAHGTLHNYMHSALNSMTADQIRRETLEGA